MISWVHITVLLCVTTLAQAGPGCQQLYSQFGISLRFNETVAHAIHSLTVGDLRTFNPAATSSNGVPVVNPRLNDPKTLERVVSDAPEEYIGEDFDGEAMNVIDSVLSTIGKSSDGLGPNWSPLERIVHKFHMRDLWKKLVPYYQQTLMVLKNEENSEELCNCLRDVKNNGIFDAVDWIALHYKRGTPITLLNRPIPKLVDADSWTVWRSRLLHYYHNEALNDAATYLACALNAF